MSSRAWLAYEHSEGHVTGVYLHSGHPVTVAPRLLTYWTQPTAVLALISGGSVSVLGRRIGARHTFESRFDVDDTTFYARDRGGPVEIVNHQDRPALLRWLMHDEEPYSDFDWLYLYSGGSWYTAKVQPGIIAWPDGQELRPLKVPRRYRQVSRQYAIMTRAGGGKTAGPLLGVRFRGRLNVYRRVSSDGRPALWEFIGAASSLGVGFDGRRVRATWVAPWGQR